MKNIAFDIQGDKLVITVDLSRDFGESKSGKTIIVASTGGNVLLEGRLERVGLTVFRPLDTQ